MPFGSTSSRRTVASQASRWAACGGEPHGGAGGAADLSGVGLVAGEGGQVDLDLHRGGGPGQGRQLTGLHGDSNHLGESVGAALVGGAQVLRSGGDQERCQRSSQTGGGLSVQDPVDGVGAVEHRGQRQPAPSEVFLGVPG